MAFVDAAVNLARVMVAVLAMSLMLPVWTSVAFRANIFTAAVLTLAEAFRATLFDSAVWTSGKICTHSALSAIEFAVAVLTPAQNYTHFAPRRNVEDRKTCRGLMEGRPSAFPLQISNLTRYTRSGCSDSSFDE